MAEIGIVNPGEMGAAVAAALAAVGHSVMWASARRSSSTRERAESIGLMDVENLDAMADRADVILSICPPDAALSIAEAVSGFNGIYVDANAIAPSTSSRVEAHVTHGHATYVDAGIIGTPPTVHGTTRLYLAGSEASTIAALFADSLVEAIVIDGDTTSPSALKMAYGGWTKGTLALILALQALARAHRVEDVLYEEWARSQPGLLEKSRFAANQAALKGWRWTGEMREIARSMSEVDLPIGFHEGAAEIYKSVPRDSAYGDEDDVWTTVVDLLLQSGRKS